MGNLHSSDPRQLRWSWRAPITWQFTVSVLCVHTQILTVGVVIVCAAQLHAAEYRRLDTTLYTVESGSIVGTIVGTLQSR